MTPLRRLPDWRLHLETAIDDIRRRPFDWSTQHDCGIGLAGAVVLALTGVDVAAPWRGRYSTRDGALAAMREDGFANLADLVASLLPEIPQGPCRAGVGDIVAVTANTPFGYALGVVNGERVFVLKEDGIGTLGLLEASRAFKVG